MCMQPFASVEQLQEASVFLNKHPWIVEHVFVDVVINKRFYAPLVIWSSYGGSAPMTMPARRASKFSAKRCAASLPIFFKLTSLVIPGMIEPWPECGPGSPGPGYTAPVLLRSSLAI